MEPKVREVPQALYVKNRYDVSGFVSVIRDCTMFITHSGENSQLVRNDYLSNNLLKNLSNIVVNYYRLTKKCEKIMISFFDRFHDQSEQMVVGEIFG